MKRHLLVTNDFPPKIGGIQSYLWELWRRLPADSFAVLTTPYSGDDVFDKAQWFRVERSDHSVLMPSSAIADRINSLAKEIHADYVVLDPLLPLGAIGPKLNYPYVVILHGAEVTLPARVPVMKARVKRVLEGAAHIIAAGNYPLAEAQRVAQKELRATVIPPGVDTERFKYVGPQRRRAARATFGLPLEEPLIVSVSRLVPRKGFDVLIKAADLLAVSHPDLIVAIAGSGRDEARLRRLAKNRRAPVRFLGRVPDRSLPELYGSADVFSMTCRNRWAGLEQEGFGIVFLEAAASGVPSVAGASGGSHEAVADGETGYVVSRPQDPDEVADAIEPLLDSPELRTRMGITARRRAVAEFSYDLLADRLHRALQAI